MTQRERRQAGLYFCAIDPEIHEERLGRPIGTGRFGADMQVSLTNDGPVTIWIDSKARE